MGVIEGNVAKSFGDSEVIEVRGVNTVAVERSPETLAIVADTLKIASNTTEKNGNTIESLQEHVKSLTTAVEVTLQKVNNIRKNASKLEERSRHLDRWVYAGSHVQRDTMHMSGCHGRSSYSRMSGYEHKEVEHSRKRCHAHKEVEHKRAARGRVRAHRHGCDHEVSEEHELDGSTCPARMRARTTTSVIAKKVCTLAAMVTSIGRSTSTSGRTCAVVSASSRSTRTRGSACTRAVARRIASMCAGAALRTSAEYANVRQDGGAQVYANMHMCCCGHKQAARKYEGGHMGGHEYEEAEREHERKQMRALRPTKEKVRGGVAQVGPPVQMGISRRDCGLA